MKRRNRPAAGGSTSSTSTSGSTPDKRSCMSLSVTCIPRFWTKKRWATGPPSGAAGAADESDSRVSIGGLELSDERYRPVVDQLDGHPRAQNPPLPTHPPPHPPLKPPGAPPGGR